VSGSLGAVALALVVLLSAGGYLLMSAAIRGDRRAAARRSANADSDRAQALLQRASAYVAGLSQLLAKEAAPGQQRFAFLAETTSASFGLVDALWIQAHSGSLVARYATTLSPGSDVSSFRTLVSPIVGRTVVFGVNATRLGSLSGQAGFYLLQSGRFGNRPGSSGYLAVFVPRGWMTLSLGADPRQLAVRLDGQPLEGRLRGPPAATVGFQALGQSWQVAVPLAAPTDLQATLPWIALSWPIVAAILVLVVSSAIARRRRAERAVERIFDLSLDMLCIAGYDGFFKNVNPAFAQTLGYSSEELLTKPFFEFVHPDDHQRTRQVYEALLHGRDVSRFENRYIRRDGSECWLEWNVRPGPGERVMYGAARDVTERRRSEEQVRQAQAALKASRDQLRRLADEQAALRRVATLVARGVSPTEVFDAVTSEMRGLLRAQTTSLLRYGRHSTATVLASDADQGMKFEIGKRFEVQDDSVSALVKRTGRSTGIIELSEASGETGRLLRELGQRYAAGAPIVVEGELWGVIGASWGQQPHRSADVEGRMTQFTGLVATAIANADSRVEIAASRARVVAAADETRRRIERDLHDGTQQRLVSLLVALRAANATIPPELGDLKRELAETERGLTSAVAELQEISRGIHPAILSKGGLRAALGALVRRARVPVDLAITIPERLPQAIEVAAYYFVSEGLTNASKHADASLVHVAVSSNESAVEILVSDDGVGGAEPTKGSGLTGLRDRVEALGGTVQIVSDRGQGTSLRATVPLDFAERPQRPSQGSVAGWSDTP